ncbi:MAG: transcription-repair coupling factor, partial [Chitinophagaceae bacterium]|nr:transcription-repair coupling factor [Chitinophagaceae bacterium]
MGVKELLELYQNNPRLFQLADRLSYASTEKNPVFYLDNLQGSASQFVVAAAFLHPALAQQNHLIILNDPEEAAYFHNTLENLTEALDLFYFPSSFKNRKNFQLLNSSHVMLRTEALTKLATGGNKKIIVTSPEALFEKVGLPSTLSQNIIHIKSGDTLDTSALLLRLSDYGFERTDFVYEPGQFAIRGGILDIYSFGNEKPYRVELFGNEVDSIRIIDPETQLSERKLLQVSIIPNMDVQISSEERISLLDFMPENTVVWIQDYAICREQLADNSGELHAFLEMQAGWKALEDPATTKRGKAQADEQDDKLHKKTVLESDFITVAEFEQSIARRKLVGFGPDNS